MSREVNWFVSGFCAAAALSAALRGQGMWLVVCTVLAFLNAFAASRPRG